MFFEFNQNNSGGCFNFDKKRGITHIVVIEAKTKKQASAKAQDIGIYFNGVSKGMDCECCGDRWDEPWEEGTEKPMHCGMPVEKATSLTAWMKPGHEICVHYLNGKKKWFGVAEEKSA